MVDEYRCHRQAMHEAPLAQRIPAELRGPHLRPGPVVPALRRGAPLCLVFAFCLPLVLWAFWIGIYPKPFFKVLEKPVAAIVQRVNPAFYAAPAAAPQHAAVPPATVPAPAVNSPAGVAH